MRKTYLERLEFWARWMLPAQEAESVMMDYRDSVGTPPRPEAELLRDLGRPRDAVRPLAEPRAYRRWLAVFALLAACILIPGITAHGPLWPIWDWCFYAPAVRIGGIYFGVRGPLFVMAGLAAALVWFRPRGHKAGRMPKGVPVLLALAAMLLTMESLCLLMMLSGPSDGWYLLPLGVDCAVFAAGLAGAGVLLC